MRKILVIGHSHIEAVRKSWSERGQRQPGVAMEFVSMRLPRLLRAGSRKPAWIAARVDKSKLEAYLGKVGAGAELTVLCFNGNEHNVAGLTGDLGSARADTLERLERMVAARQEEWLELVLPLSVGTPLVVLPPPPVESEARIRAGMAQLGERAFWPAAHRLALWQAQCDALRRTAQRRRIAVIESPPAAHSAAGFLDERYFDTDPTHGNAAYGALLVERILAPEHARAASHPYAHLPDYMFWKQAVSQVERGLVDPVTAPRFVIQPEDAVATAGSCFAQHISKRLRGAGFSFMQAETGGEYDFSARYGNVYTARQLLQLFDRAFGYFRPQVTHWQRDDGRWCDPFRPRIEPDGFATPQALAADVRAHLVAVRRMFRELDVMVFTLGLTECWASRLDGAVYPLSPGVAGGTYDPAQHEFLNFGVDEVVADLDRFVRKLQLVNRRARVIITVSPVPLVATYEDRHVLVSSTYSKSVLRVAAEQIAARHPAVQYFPSYEIITGAHAGTYFSADRRNVTEAGVDHVMRVFMSHLTQQPADAATAEAEPFAGYAEVEAIAEAACDEQLLAR